MRKWFWLCVLCLFSLPIIAQEIELTEQERSIIEMIKAKNQTPPVPSSDPMQVPPHAVDTTAADSNIQLSDFAKQQAWEEQKQTSSKPLSGAEQTPSQDTTSADVSDAKCLTVAFIDIDVAFNAHPRTQAVKKQIDQKIKSKQREVQNAKDVIAALEAENQLLVRQLTQIKPFYERIITDQPLGPKVPESTDTLQFNNALNHLIFAGSEVLSATPLNTPGRVEDLTDRISANKKIIAERNFFIDNYKYQTREEILKLEQEEVKEILQDIYAQIKSFAQKRNIGAVVRKDEILYGQKPVNVTKDFVSQLKKSKKYHKK